MCGALMPTLAPIVRQFYLPPGNGCTGGWTFVVDDRPLSDKQINLLVLLFHAGSYLANRRQ